MNNFQKAKLSWARISDIEQTTFTCGYCGKIVGSDRGYCTDGANEHRVYICPFCNRPTYVHGSKQYPGAAFGESIEFAPNGVGALYDEARVCMSVGAYTSAVLACRKLLMHIAVSLKANEGLKFYEYVDYLADNHYIPPTSKEWVNHIRNKGNEANHEIVLAEREVAEDLITFSSMLLKTLFEFPNRVRKPSPQNT